MKISFILLALLIGFVASSVQVNAQTLSSAYKNADGLILSVGAESGASLGKFRDNYNWMTGGEIQVDIPLFKRTYVSINAGYANYFGKTYLNKYGQKVPDVGMHLLPVMTGFKTFWIKGFYTEGISGVGFDLNKNQLGYNRSAAFIFAQQIGYQFCLKDNNYLDAGIRYTGSGRFSQSDAQSKISSLGIKVGYAFGPK
jgi:hypothetical protein